MSIKQKAVDGADDFHARYAHYLKTKLKDTALAADGARKQGNMRKARLLVKKYDRLWQAERALHDRIE